ncbi:hypothetical protein EHQ81_07495 [Leptospira selangorensis]|uniref:DUF1640 domain-containing protein n=1 Tax=Leptospira selangorensis TaxID=2484982 RepID=A0A4R9GEF1_9LEPT|nr:hypothetical protein [Leptospira selangorensis]TGK09487.1 hypothetical protein EHO58_03665 [Leptospira selangorensis]TGM16218.1 hypothetical protein EHQ81_07495 [Leptospira selangorensis]TGM17832.1 hypothetical protein EHQ82_12210 [Leptospira selangorensis]
MMEPIVLVPKALRNSLGEEGAEALVSLLNQANLGGRKFMEEFVSERFERRLMEETGKLRLELKEETGKLWIAIAELRAEMHAGFAGIQEQFKEVYKEIAKLHERIAEVHRSIASQTRWMVAVIIASVLPIYLGLAKLIFQ